MQPRKKLGSNLGIAPSFELLTQAPPPVAPVPPPVALEATTTNEPAAASEVQPDEEAPPPRLPEQAPTRASVAESTSAVAPAPTVSSPAVVSASSKASRPSGKTPTAPKAPPPIPELPKRVHGTFSDPYARKTDGIETRQTTLTVALDLDDRFETFFRKQRGKFKTRSALWAAAMEFYLQEHT